MFIFLISCLSCCSRQKLWRKFRTNCRKTCAGNFTLTAMHRLRRLPRHFAEKLYALRRKRLFVCLQTAGNAGRIRICEEALMACPVEAIGDNGSERNYFQPFNWLKILENEFISTIINAKMLPSVETSVKRRQRISFIRHLEVN
jgi:hypothetical protein